eukprot:CAMPEP_0117590634 /NCGR_PEP_ID=MMETSP0784-20121206/71087_1 /TAXON_ID=39447 /ORGANISM="" /LENGTH=36 /DNA_ID= /DNA_START= /DNA_END= /DNA_ORIENTATION=
MDEFCDASSRSTNHDATTSSELQAANAMAPNTVDRH